MIDMVELNAFLEQRCVPSHANVPFAAFLTAFQAWLPDDRVVYREELLDAMSSQPNYDVHQSPGQRTVVLRCAMPEDQREMTPS